MLFVTHLHCRWRFRSSGSSCYSRRAERKRQTELLVGRRQRAEAEIEVMREVITKRAEQERQRQGKEGVYTRHDIITTAIGHWDCTVFQTAAFTFSSKGSPSGLVSP